MNKKINKLIQEFGQTYSEELGIDLESKKSGEIFKWFLASILFGKRIGENIAKSTYMEFKKEGILTPRRILNAGWDRLVKILDAGGYVRYDYSTATRLLGICKNLLEWYGGSLLNLHNSSKNPRDLEKRLQMFKGIGPVTTNIFLREMRTIWKKADPEPSERIKKAAQKLGISIKNINRKTKSFARLECALLRWGKNAHRRN